MEDEQREFRAFVACLRQAKDKAEFDRRMAQPATSAAFPGTLSVTPSSNQGGGRASRRQMGCNPQRRQSVADACVPLN
jgi:Protein of unknown function (DUF2852)